MNITDSPKDPVADNFKPIDPQKEFLIVGLGASAGGIQALKAFFEQVPAGSGVAYVVILHLSPDHDSQLADILQKICPIPVIQVTEKMLVEPDRVYVIAPTYHLKMEDGYLAVYANQSFAERRAPIDIFYRTLAESHGPRAVSVLLSGTGPNGSMGLKRIKERGGAVFVQNPKEAEFNELPRTAIATGMVDAVLPVADMAAKILSYKDSMGLVQIPEEPAQRPDDHQQALDKIFATLKLQTSHDFSEYKVSTILRRIERRMIVRHVLDLPAYSAYLRKHPEETESLLNDLLISVTNFFRDSKAFEVLEQEVMPALFRGKSARDQVRIWVAGCATGEEAYSIAMLCAEQQDKMSSSPTVQIFATDISEDAIAHARAALYSKSDTADVPPDRLKRFFEHVGVDYRIRREIREMVLFANQNFINNPPFSSLNLVSCRNVLIYLNASIQERVIETFHFALLPEGFLFLGNSESLSGDLEMYATINREHRIFQKKRSKVRGVPMAQQISTMREVRMPQVPPKKEITSTNGNGSLAAIHQRFRAESAPPSLLVDSKYNILHISAGADRYLRVASGQPTQNLLKMVREEFRFELRAAFYQATQQQITVKVKGLQIEIEGKTEVINILVRPAPQQKDIPADHLLVVFEGSEGEQNNVLPINSTGTIIRNLEEELIGLDDQLRTNNEQHDFQAEELMASNEELQTIVEELRSATEELETSREELQSINEELRTVNQELKVKLEELSNTSTNLQNLINSTNIGTIFLDRNLRVILFTPAIRGIFNLIQADHGRPLTDISHALIGVDLAQDIYSVMDSLDVLEREVRANRGNVYVMRIHPYRSGEDRINGVVLTFVNITERKMSEEALQKSEERFRIALEAGELATWDWDLESNRVVWNLQHFAILGMEPTDNDLPPEAFIDRVYPDDLPLVRGQLENALKNNGVYQPEFRIVKQDSGEIRWMYGYGRVTHRNNGKPTRMTGVMYDITQRKLLEQQKDEFMSSASHELKTPVTSIKAYAEIIQSAFEETDDEQNAGLMKKMNAQVDRLTDLIKNLLDTTRLLEGQLPLQQDQFDFSALVSEKVQDLQTITSIHKLVLDMPDTVSIQADRERIGQVLTNLISNAIKYSPRGGDVTIHGEVKEGAVEVSVTDTGIGIPEGALQKVFDRFFRVSHAEIRSYPGLGLGLYISAGILKRHGGSIWVESRKGEGSTFTFRLPLVPEG